MRKIIAAIVAGFILGTAGTVTAAPTVQAVFAKFNFVIDGKKVDPGVDPLVYQGTTYLPVRVFSNLLGYDVTYKADSRTIVLTKPTTGGGSSVDNTVITDLDKGPEGYVPIRHIVETYGVSYQNDGKFLNKANQVLFTIDDVEHITINYRIYISENSLPWIEAQIQR